MNIWKSRCEIMLNLLSPTPSQRKFILSVARTMDTSGKPTQAQQRVLSNIWLHCVRVYADEQMMEQLEAEELV